MFKRIPTRCYVCSNSFILFLSWMVVNNTHRSLQWISNSDGTFLIAISNSDALKSTRKNYVAQVTSACLCSACSVSYFFIRHLDLNHPRKLPSYVDCCSSYSISDLLTTVCQKSVCQNNKHKPVTAQCWQQIPSIAGEYRALFKDLPAVPTLPTVCAYSEVFLFTVF